MAVRPLRGISLCSGIGGIDLGLTLAMDDGYRTVCYVEREAFAAASLVARMEDETLDRAPVWSDIETFEGTPWRGVVDLVHGGVPCQPFSNASQLRKGVEDHRWLWPEMWRIVQETEAPLLFLENIENFIQRGLPHVLKDLAEGGFDAVWMRLSAASVGAPHIRTRCFLLGYAHDCRESVVSLHEEASRLREDARLAGSWRKAPSRNLRMDDGIPSGLDRLHALGNAVVPQVAAEAWFELTGAVARAPR